LLVHRERDGVHRKGSGYNRHRTAEEPSRTFTSENVANGEDKTARSSLSSSLLCHGFDNVAGDRLQPRHCASYTSSEALGTETLVAKSPGAGIFRLCIGNKIHNRGRYVSPSTCPKSAGETPEAALCNQAPPTSQRVLHRTARGCLLQLKLDLYGVRPSAL